MSLGPQSASATSLNFLGFEDIRGFGTPDHLFNRIFIEPNLPEATSSGNIAAAGYVPGQQSYLKRRQTIWSKSSLGKHLYRQGFKRV